MGYRSKKRKEYQSYNYKCAVTAEEFTLTAKAKEPEELVTVKAYYELHPDKDDRPAHVKKLLGFAPVQPTVTEEKQ